MRAAARPALGAAARLLLAPVAGSAAASRSGSRFATAAATTRTSALSFHTSSFAAKAAAEAAPEAPRPPPSTTAKGPRFTMAASANAAGSRLKAAPTASGVLVDPYRGEPPPLPLTAWVTPSGWGARWARWVGGAKSMYTLAKLRKLVPGFELASFKAEAGGLYASVCASLAGGDRPALRDLLTPTEYTAAKRQLKARAEGGWEAVEWGLSGSGGGGGGGECEWGWRGAGGSAPGPPGDGQPAGRAGGVRPGDGGAGLRPNLRRPGWARARPRHVRAGRGEPGAGEWGRCGRARPRPRPAPSPDPDPAPAPSPPSPPPSPRHPGGVPPAMAVRDVWVLERFLGGGPASRWRVAARLPDPPPRVPAPAWWGWLTGRR